MSTPPRLASPFGRGQASALHETNAPASTAVHAATVAPSHAPAHDTSADVDPIRAFQADRLALLDAPPPWMAGKPRLSRTYGRLLAAARQLHDPLQGPPALMYLQSHLQKIVSTAGLCLKAGDVNAGALLLARTLLPALLGREPPQIEQAYGFIESSMAEMRKRYPVVSSPVVDACLRVADAAIAAAEGQHDVAIGHYMAVLQQPPDGLPPAFLAELHHSAGKAALHLGRNDLVEHFRQLASEHSAMQADALPEEVFNWSQELSLAKKPPQAYATMFGEQRKHLQRTIGLYLQSGNPAAAALLAGSIAPMYAATPELRGKGQAFLESVGPHLQAMPPSMPKSVGLIGFARLAHDLGLPYALAVLKEGVDTLRTQEGVNGRLECLGVAEGVARRMGAQQEVRHLKALQAVAHAEQGEHLLAHVSLVEALSNTQDEDIRCAVLETAAKLAHHSGKPEEVLHLAACARNRRALNGVASSPQEPTDILTDMVEQAKLQVGLKAAAIEAGAGTGDDVLAKLPTQAIEQCRREKSPGQAARLAGLLAPSYVGQPEAGRRFIERMKLTLRRADEESRGCARLGFAQFHDAVDPPAQHGSPATGLARRALLDLKDTQDPQLWQQAQSTAMAIAQKRQDMGRTLPLLAVLNMRRRDRAASAEMLQKAFDSTKEADLCEALDAAALIELMQGNYEAGMKHYSSADNRRKATHCPRVRETAEDFKPHLEKARKKLDDQWLKERRATQDDGEATIRQFRFGG